MRLPENTLLQGGKYKIVKFLSAGGFGCTYKADHVMLRKQVAIKEFFVKDFCNRDENTAHVTVGTVSKKDLVDKLRRKFVDEARSLCQLQHPGIVRVSDVFEENGTAYFVMDYINGGSLGDMVKKSGKLSEERAIRYIRQVAKALQYVHDNNRLHLDVKPGNIMVDSDDNAVLIDFGASKQYDEESGENTSTLMGKTPGYAPLEQMGNDLVKFTPATDVYALGATLYKLLTGNTPPSATLLASGEELPPLPGNTSEGVRHAIEQAMIINKKSRIQTAQEFLDLLGAGTDEEEVEENDDTTIITGGGEPTSTRYYTPTDEEMKQTQELVEQANQKRKTLYIVIAVLAGLLVFFIALPFIVGPEPEVVNEPKEPDLENYTNRLGTGFVYSGARDDEGHPHGYGKGMYRDGAYEGNYEHGLRSGQGSFTTRDQKNHYEGTWSNDQYDTGRLTLEDGSYYEGSFKNNSYHKGKYYNADGTFEAMIDY